MLVNRDLAEIHCNGHILLFTHIPKCAGTSAMVFLEKLFGKKFLALWTPEMHDMIKRNPAALSAQYDCIVSHRPFGDHILFDRPVSYVSLVRDPLDRLISLYNYARSRPDHVKHETCKSMSIDEWISLWLLTEYQNVNCYYLSGTHFFGPAASSCLTNYVVIADTSELREFFAVLGHIVTGASGENFFPPHENRSRGATKSDVSPATKALAKQRLTDDFRLVHFVKSGGSNVLPPCAERNAPRC